MVLKQFQKGRLGADGITLLVGAAALAGLLIYSAQSGYALPLWPALAVVAVNLIAAARLAWAVIKAKKRRQAPAK